MRTIECRRLVASLMVLALCGCARTSPVPPPMTDLRTGAESDAPPAETSWSPPPSSWPPPKTVIRPGDEIGISYFKRPPVEAIPEYRIDFGDELSIRVKALRTYESDVVVRSDGRISFFEIGDVFVHGKSIPDVRSEIQARFQRILPAADVTVFLTRSDAVVDEFIQALIGNQSLGTFRPLRVRIDGITNFPLIGELQVSGKTLPELSALLEQEYNRLFRGRLAVTAQLISSYDNQVVVLGEVRRPGTYRIYDQARPGELLALAGGALETADLETAVLIRNPVAGGMERQFVNLNPKTNPAGLASITLEPRDILIIPRSGIAELNLWVEQYIRRMLPIGAGFGAGYDLSAE